MLSCLIQHFQAGIIFSYNRSLIRMSVFASSCICCILAMMNARSGFGFLGQYQTQDPRDEPEVRKMCGR
jgi:hypothetical protein